MSTPLSMLKKTRRTPLQDSLMDEQGTKVYFHLHTDCVSCAGLSPNGGFQMNFDLVLRRIRELNVLAGEGESFVQATGTGAKLAKKDPIQLRLYRNGIVMFDGPFRSYQEHSTQQCMQDLMDGYFPSELQQRFPDGIPFEVRLCNDEIMVRTPWHTFPGDGQAVCGKESTNSVDRRLNTDQFLNKLPKVVVKAGNVFDIRGSLRRTLQVSSRDPSFTLTNPNLRLTNTPVLSSGGTGQPGYDIISAYPRCSFGDDNRTLQSCGLSGNFEPLLP
uniref:UBX domain-containing protein 11 n=1 Tax=Poecilia reticulata TaxID=8081 RepID=A0A3P9NVH6_POERE